MPEKNRQVIQSDDPYEGFSSCPDARRAYLLQSKENQIQWMIKSEEVIRKFITQLASFKDFRQAYSYLANQRHQLALELNHKGDDGRTDHFGLFRLEGDHYRHSVSAGEGENFWKWQKNKLFELTYQLIEPVKRIKIFAMKPGYLYEDKNMTCLKEQVVVDDKNAIYYCVTVKFPFEDAPIQHVAYSRLLSQIELYDFEEDKRFNLIRIEYTPADNQNTTGNYLILDKYYQKLLNWKSEDGIENFLKNAAKLAFMTSHLLLVKHGNNAMIEWLIRAVAYHKGIKIGRFNHSEGVSWDFKAILTPDINHYVKWFCEKLFVDYKLLNPSENNADFSFN